MFPDGQTDTPDVEDDTHINMRYVQQRPQTMLSIATDSKVAWTSVCTLGLAKEITDVLVQ